MEDIQSLCHTVWDCKYHVVWIPKYRKKVLYGKLRKELGPIIKELARQKESEVVEGKLVLSDEQAIRAYIQAQEEVDRRLDQMKLWEKDK